MQKCRSGDIEHEVQEKCHKMFRKGLAFQPFIIVCGRNFMELNAFYVRIDSLTYETSSLLQALHILYQFYIRFNINYPIESENFCYFVQWGMYCIKSEWDVKIPLIYNYLKKKIKNFENKLSNKIKI